MRPRLHEVTIHVADIERQLRQEIEAFDGSAELRICRLCGYVQPEHPAQPASLAPA